MLPDHEPPSAELVNALAVEYGLATPVRVEGLGGRGHRTFKIRSPAGAFVAKWAWRPDEVALYARVAEFLNSRGVRQARLIPTRTETWVAPSGFFLCEFLDGTTDLSPSRDQTIAAMALLGEYHRILGEGDFDWQRDPDGFWTRVGEVDYLLAVLPGHVDDSPPADRPVLLAALRYLDDHAERLGELKRQLVHGDVAPDNVVMADDEVVAIIDFTPFREPVLFAVACALYWFHVHGKSALSVGEVALSLDACGRSRRWSHDELALAPAMLVREALRRLATPLEAPAPMRVSRASLAARRRSLRLIVESLRPLEQLASDLRSGPPQ